MSRIRTWTARGSAHSMNGTTIAKPMNALGEFFMLSAESLVTFVRRPWAWSQIVDGIIGFLTLTTGALVAVQGYGTLSNIGVEALTGFLSAFLNVRMIVPCIAGLALAATIGATALPQTMAGIRRDDA